MLLLLPLYYTLYNIVPVARSSNQPSLFLPTPKKKEKGVVGGGLQVFTTPHVAPMKNAHTTLYFTFFLKKKNEMERTATHTKKVIAQKKKKILTPNRQL